MVCPTSEMAATSVPRGGDVGVIALMGVLGAALSATLAVQKLRGTASPYAVPVALACFKLPAGALTAIAGLLLIKGDLFPAFPSWIARGRSLRMPSSLVSRSIWSRVLSTSGPTTW